MLDSNYTAIIQAQKELALATKDSRLANATKKKAKVKQYTNAFVISANIGNKNISAQKVEFFKLLANAKDKALADKKNPHGYLFDVKQIEKVSKDKLDADGKPLNYTIDTCDQIEELRRIAYSDKARETFRNGTTTKEVSKYLSEKKLSSQNKIKQYFVPTIKQSSFDKWKEDLAEERGFSQEEAVRYILSEYKGMIEYVLENKKTA